MTYRIDNEEEIKHLKAELAKEYIAYIDAVKNKIAVAEERLEMLEAATGLGAIDYSKDLISTSVSPDAIPNAVIRMIEANDKQQEDIGYKKVEVDAFDKRIAALESKGGLILQFIYGLGIKDKDIYHMYMPMPRSTYFRTKTEGLVELYDKGLPEKFLLPDIKAV